MKIIASDYDGTINYGGVSEKDREAIRRFRKAGNKFGVVTGRDLEGARWIINNDGVELDFLICCTGAIITDGCGKIIYEDAKDVDKEAFSVILSEAKRLGAWGANITYRTLKYQVDLTGNIPYDDNIMKKFTHLNTWFKGEEEAKEFAKIITEKCGDVVSVYQNGKNVDMPPKNNSKTTGIHRYVSEFEGAEVYTVGDNFNDIPMLKEFKSFAVSNAKDAVKEAADYTCDRICDMIDILIKGDI